ncbi:MAG: hypothetical protein R2795_14840 [Saprospiraceae bacterium]
MKGNAKPNKIEVTAMQANLGESDFSGNGTLLNVFDYLFDEGTLAGNMYLKSGF